MLWRRDAWTGKGGAGLVEPNGWKAGTEEEGKGSRGRTVGVEGGGGRGEPRSPASQPDTPLFSDTRDTMARPAVAVPLRRNTAEASAGNTNMRLCQSLAMEEAKRAPF